MPSYFLLEVGVVINYQVVEFDQAMPYLMKETKNTFLMWGNFKNQECNDHRLNNQTSKK
jgi:hypothetical protein